MPNAVFHPCRFNFDDVDIRRVGAVTSGGTSLSGIDDPIETDGGGYWRADFTNGEAFEREDALAWRAQTEAMDNGATAVIVYLCSERHFQPVEDRVGDAPNVILPDDAPDKGAAFTMAAAALRATSGTITGNSERAVEPGMLFSVNHPTWGWRVYRLISVGDGGAIGFRPPLREAVTAGTEIEFDYPRCKMRGQATSNPTSQGRYTSGAIAFVEDMRKPAIA